jgi:hypothetical protein
MTNNKLGIEHWQDGYKAGLKAGVKKGLKTKLKSLKDHELIEETISRGIAVAMIHTNQIEIKKNADAGKTETI